MRHLPDIELAALLAAVHLGLLFMTRHSPFLTEYFGRAGTEVEREVIARHAGDPGPERLFPDDALQQHEFEAVRDVVRHLCQGLAAKGFHAAARVLSERLAADATTDPPSLKQSEAVESRVLN